MNRKAVPRPRIYFEGMEMSANHVSWMLIKPVYFDKIECLRFGERLFIKEILRPTDAPVGPGNVVLFAKILYHIEVDVLRLLDLTDIYDLRTGKQRPLRGDDALRYVGRSHDQVIVRPAGLGDFKHLEILELIELPAEFCGEIRDLCFRSLKSLSWRFPQTIGDSESDQFIWIGV